MNIQVYMYYVLICTTSTDQKALDFVSWEYQNEAKKRWHYCILNCDYIDCYVLCIFVQIFFTFASFRVFFGANMCVKLLD